MKMSFFRIAKKYHIKLTFNMELNLRHELAQIFGAEVDLVDIPRASPLLLNEISKNGKLLYGAQALFLELRRKSFHKFEDYRHYIEFQNKINRKNLYHAK